MKRVLTILSALGLCLWASDSLANGGGYAFGVTFTGSLAPFQASGTDQVRILEENLDVSLRRTDASVVVRYTMKNVSDQPVRVRFGFPVEATKSNPYEDSPPWSDPGSTSQQQSLRETYQQLDGYSVSADGVPVKAEFIVEPFAAWKIKPFPGSEALKNIKGWMVSEVIFPAETPTLVEIRYAADYMSEGTFVSDDVHASPLSFVYRLSTGAVWRGPIAKGTVTILADGIPAEEVEIAAPPSRFKRDGDRWVWKFQDLKPTLADDITIRAIPGYLEVGAYRERPAGSLSYIERNGKWGVSHQRFKATASSTLAATKEHGFGAGNLSGGYGEAPWSEGVPGNGVGEWVEIVPTTSAPLLGLSIVPGFYSQKRPELFKANGRPSRVEILLNGEHRFAATLGDKAAPQFIPVLGYSKPVSKLRITLLEVRPGTMYQDTCISRVDLYDRLKKKPEMRGAR